MKNRDYKYICFGFFLLTLSNSNSLVSIGIDKWIEYLGLGLILMVIYKNKQLLSSKGIRFLLRFFIVLAFFCVGICLQYDLANSRKISLVLSMFILASTAIFPSGIIQSTKCLEYIARGVICGVLTSTCFSLILFGTVINKATEGIIIEYGFNGGLQHRNYYAYAILCVIFIYYFKYKQNHKKKDLHFLFFLVFLLIISNSRSSYAILLLFLLVMNHHKIKLYKNKNLFNFGIIILIMIVFALPICYYFATISETFLFRINGLNNYIKYYKDDWFHLIFGNSEMAFRTSGMTYDQNIRSVVGWDGSTELVVLNVLVKNGILGFVGYIYIFCVDYKRIKKIKNEKVKNYCFALLLCFICSAFVESYLANINFPFTVFNYLILCGLSNNEPTRVKGHMLKPSFEIID